MFDKLVNTRTVSGAIAIAALAMLLGGPAKFAAAGDIKPLLTLDGKPPLVLGHRGLPGLMPEETLPSYDMAAALGTDALEEDLHLTKDCILVARHNPWLSDNTNVAEFATRNPAVAARKRTVPGALVKVSWATTPDSGPAEYLTDLTDPSDPKSVLKSLVVDGEDHTNDWSITDFTLAELKAWFGGTTYDAAKERPAEFNGKFTILSFEEIIDLAKPRARRSVARSPSIPRPRTRPGTTRRPSPTAAARPAAVRWKTRSSPSSRRTASTPRTRRSSCRASSPAA